MSDFLPSEFLQFQQAELVIGSISLLLTSTILYFIFFRTPESLYDFRPYLFAITFSDFVFDVVVVMLMRPVVLFPAIAAVVTGPLQYLGGTLAFHATVGKSQWREIFAQMFGIFAWLYCQISINLAFVFRYVCVAKFHLKDYFSSRRTQLAMNLVGAAICASAIGFAWLNPASIQEGNPLPLVVAPTLQGHLNATVIVAIHDSTLVLRVFGASIVGFLFGTSGFNWFFAVATIRKLRTHQSSLNAVTYKMHLRLIGCLVCQTFCPLLLLVLPVIVMVYFWAIRAPCGPFQIASRGFILMLACHPLVNAVCTLYFIQPYRQILIKDQWIRFVKSRVFGKVYSRDTTEIVLQPVVNVSSPKHQNQQTNSTTVPFNNKIMPMVAIKMPVEE